MSEPGAKNRHFNYLKRKYFKDGKRKLVRGGPIAILALILIIVLMSTFVIVKYVIVGLVLSLIPLSLYTARYDDDLDHQ
jgi:hypothetical protein